MQDLGELEKYESSWPLYCVKPELNTEMQLVDYDKSGRYV